jgi:hypothetical protein
MKKQTAKQVVEEKKEELQKKTVAELVQFGKESGFDSRAGFSSYKRALRDVAGIDFDALNAARREEKAQNLAATCKYHVKLYSDAKASYGRFAICDGNGEVVWYGRFFDGEGSEQSEAEMEAAKKAVWLASKIAEALNEKAIVLTLYVDAEWLTWANGTDPKVGGKARTLRESALKHNVSLDVVHVAGAENPADKWTTEKGFKKWSDNNLPALANQYDPDCEHHDDPDCFGGA